MDEDTASFTKVVESQPCGDELKSVKLKCAGNYQKQAGNCLWQKRKYLKGVKLSDGKGSSGKGRLSDKVINTLQNYVGMILTQDSNDITEMRISEIDVKILEKCLHGMTQNCNDTFNQLIWNRYFKNIFTSKKEKKFKWLWIL